MSRRRWPALLVLVAIVAALVAASARRSAPGQPTFGRALAAATPTASGQALSTTWFCAAGTAATGTAFNLSVILASTASTTRHATITWYPSPGGRRTQSVDVPANGTSAVAATAMVRAPVVSALVEVDGGQVAVEHGVSGSSGSSVAPCATSASTSWYLANGVTEKDAREILALFNPFPDDAVVDISFATDQGRAEPRAVQGLPVPAGSTVFVNAQDVVRRRAVVATSVVARTGRLVVDRLQAFDGTAGRSGISLSLAAATGATSWYFPDGLFQLGLSETWHVYNPGGTEAQVSLHVVPVTGDAPDAVQLTVPPRSQATIDASTVNAPAAVAHSSTVTSENDVPIVVERALDARRPAPRLGWSSMLGATTTAKQWLFAAGEANGNTDEWIVVMNPGARRVTVSLAALTGGYQLPVEDSQELTLPPAGRLAIRLGDHISRAPLPILVTASGPIVAERDAYSLRRIGASAVAGLPFVG